MRRLFIPAFGRSEGLAIGAGRLGEAERAIRLVAPRYDVYCGVLLRWCRAGGREAVAPSHLAFVEIDHGDAIDRLPRFATLPSMIVSSGTAGHAHAYWTLRTRVGAIQLEQANRTLASHLGGDLANVDAARILRPAGTLSHKHRPPAPVELLHLDAPPRTSSPSSSTVSRQRPHDRPPPAGYARCPHRARRAAARHPGGHLRPGANRA